MIKHRRTGKRVGLLDQFTPTQVDKACSIANDIAEGSDKGESRKELRAAVSYFALAEHYAGQRALSAESRMRMAVIGSRLVVEALKSDRLLRSRSKLERRT